MFLLLSSTVGKQKNIKWSICLERFPIIMAKQTEVNVKNTTIYLAFRQKALIMMFQGIIPYPP